MVKGKKKINGKIMMGLQDEEQITAMEGSMVNLDLASLMEPGGDSSRIDTARARKTSAYGNTP